MISIMYSFFSTNTLYKKAFFVFVSTLFGISLFDNYPGMNKITDFYNHILIITISPYNVNMGGI